MSIRLQQLTSRKPVAFQTRSRQRLRSGVTVKAMASDWTKQDTRRFLHAVYRVSDLDATISFLKDNFGFKQIRYRDVPDEKFTNAFMIGAGDEKTNFALELTYNYGKDKAEDYNIGSGFGHFGVAVPDTYAVVDKVKKNGGKVTREPGPVKGGTSVIAFVAEPTGYKWEVLQRKDQDIPEPIAQVMLRVVDLEKSIKYYTECLGMKLLRQVDRAEQKYSLAYLGYEDISKGCIIELTYNWDNEKPYDNGDAYGQVALSSKDIYKTAEAIKAAGGKIVREPGPLPGLKTKIMSTTDPDGWKYVFVDEADFLAEL